MSSNRDQQPGLIHTAVTCIPTTRVSMEKVVPKCNAGSARLLGDFLGKQKPNATLQASWSPADTRLRPGCQQVFL